MFSASPSLVSLNRTCPPSLPRIEPDFHDDGDFRSRKDGGGWGVRLRALYDLQRRLVERRQSRAGRDARRRHLALPVHVNGHARHHSLALRAYLGRVALVLLQKLVDLLLPRRQRVHTSSGVHPSLPRRRRGWGWWRR